MSEESLLNLFAAARALGPESWSLNTGVLGGPQALKDVRRCGHFVFKPALGAIAAVPKDSPQFSRHETLMRYIAAAGPATILQLFDEVRRLRKLEDAAKAYIEWWDSDSDDDGRGDDKREAMRSFVSEKRDGVGDG